MSFRVRSENDWCWQPGVGRERLDRPASLAQDVAQPRSHLGIPQGARSAARTPAPPWARTKQAARGLLNGLPWPGRVGIGETRMKTKIMVMLFSAVLGASTHSSQASAGTEEASW